ncbi:hypothetical protein HMPREF3038_02425 [Akkermansia sp. KLE1797]|nr:hypothetical protein HMPREF3038_02425 [Akkermansia sp. KLE1797]
MTINRNQTFPTTARNRVVVSMLPSILYRKRSKTIHLMRPAIPSAM